MSTEQSLNEVEPTGDGKVDVEEVEGDWELEPVTRLVDGINLQELVSKGATFEVNSDDLYEDEPYTVPSTSEQLLAHHPFTSDSNSDDEESESPLSEFGRLEQKMEVLDSKGYLKKRVLEEGCGEKIPVNALVTIHYAAFLEYQNEPYDTTYNKGPKSYRLGAGQLLLGLEMAILSMKHREIAQFLIAPELGYGKMGVPGLITMNASLLFRVEIVNVVDSISADKFEALGTDEQKKFSTIRKVVEHHQLAAREMFVVCNYKSAIKHYNRAANLLEAVNLADMSEQEQQQRLLLKLYLNLAVCYNARDLPKKACMMCHRIRDITANKSLQTPAKAFFQHGRAKFKLHEYEAARVLLLRAKALQPNNHEIQAELAKVEQNYNESLRNDKEFSQKVLGTYQEDSDHDVLGELDQMFVDRVKDYVAHFAKSSATRQELPSALSAQEVQCFRKEARNHSMIVQSSTIGIEQIFTICKRDKDK